MSQAQALDRIRTKLEALTARSGAILNRCDAEGRSPSEGELLQLDHIEADHKKLDQEIKHRERAEDARARLVEGKAFERLDRARALITGGTAVIANAPSAGFRDLHEFIGAVQRSAAPNKYHIDPRLGPYAAALTYANEGVADQGGWAAPSGIAAGIVEAVAGVGTLLGAMAPQLVEANIVPVPVDATRPGGSSGITAAKTAEGAAVTATKPALGQSTVVLYKAVALCHVTEELASDSPAAAEALGRIVAREVRAVAEKWILRGSGAVEPLGITKSPALIAVTGTGAGTLTSTHLGSAFGRFMDGPRAFMIAGPSARGALAKIEMDGGRLPLPVISSLELPAVGTEGDAIFVNPEGFLTFTRGVQSQATIYFAFDQGLTSLRAFIRIGQAPALSAAVTPALDSNTVSHAVAVATRT